MSERSKGKEDNAEDGCGNIEALIRDGLSDAFKDVLKTRSSSKAKINDLTVTTRQPSNDPISFQEPVVAKQRPAVISVKLQFRGEIRKIMMKRPVVFEELLQKANEQFSQIVALYYTESRSEVIVPILNQEDLDQAVDLVDQNHRIKSLRVLCSQHPHNVSSTAATSNIPASSAGLPNSPTRDATGPKEAGEMVASSESPYHQAAADHVFVMPSSRSILSKLYDARHRRSSRRSGASSTKSNESDLAYEFGSSYAGSSTSSRCSSLMSTDNYQKSPTESGIATASSDFSKVAGQRRQSASSIFSQQHAHTSRDLPHSNGRFPERKPSLVGVYPSSGYSKAFSAKQGSHGASSSSSSGLVPDNDSGAGSSRHSRDGVLSATSPKPPLNWRQGRNLGNGAFGQVFLCYDADSGRELAVKKVFINPLNTSQAKEVTHFENEIRMLKDYQHPRIVQYIGCQRDECSVHIFMEYLPGGSVKEEIRQYGPLTTKVATKYTVHILEGLCYLHSHGIVHRDIKSANILRDSNGNVKIGDFGSAKRLQAICSQNGTYSFTGTPYYMAPEVVSSKGYGRKADLWSLGCTLLEMLTGKQPWADLEPIHAILKISKCQPSYSLPGHVTDQLAEFLSLLFTREPEKRPSADEALRHEALRGDDI